MFQLNTILIHDPSWPRAFMLEKKKKKGITQPYCGHFAPELCSIFVIEIKKRHKRMKKRKEEREEERKTKKRPSYTCILPCFLLKPYAPFRLTYRFGLGAWVFLSLNGILQMERSFISFGNTY